MDPEYAAWVSACKAETMREYQELKDTIWWRTARGGGLLTTYLFLVLSGEAALCSLVGMGASLVYLSWLYSDGEWLPPRCEFFRVIAQPKASVRLAVCLQWTA